MANEEGIKQKDKAFFLYTKVKGGFQLTMNLAVLIKQVPDSDEVKMDPEKGTMIREGVSSIINPLDLNALEAAVGISRDIGGRVTVLTMGPPQAEEALREAIALGADRAILLSDRAFAGADSWATSLVLAEALRKTGPYDIVLAGEKATDGETGQVGPEVAALMGYNLATYVSFLDAGPRGVSVKCTVEEGTLYQWIPLPCLLTVLNDLNEPSLPTLAGKKKARRAEILKLGLADLELTRENVGLLGSPTRVVRIETPKITRQTEFFSARDLERGIDRVIDILKEAAVI